MAYATAADWVLYYDATVIADLCSDTGVPVADLSTDPTVARLLSYGAGRINSAVTVGERYTEADLATLTGDDLQLLVELNCTLAMGKALMRRPGSQYEESYKQHTQEAEKFLDRLRKGERIFAFAANQEAGLPSVDGPTTVDYQRLRLPMDRFKHYYPSRGSTLPVGRSYGG